MDESEPSRQGLGKELGVSVPQTEGRVCGGHGGMQTNFEVLKS